MEAADLNNNKAESLYTRFTNWVSGGIAKAKTNGGWAAKEFAKCLVAASVGAAILGAMVHFQHLSGSELMGIGIGGTIFFIALKALGPKIERSARLAATNYDPEDPKTGCMGRVKSKLWNALRSFGACLDKHGIYLIIASLAMTVLAGMVSHGQLDPSYAMYAGFGGVPFFIMIAYIFKRCEQSGRSSEEEIRQLREEVSTTERNDRESTRAMNGAADGTSVTPSAPPPESPVVPPLVTAS